MLEESLPFFEIGNEFSFFVTGAKFAFIFSESDKHARWSMLHLSLLGLLKALTTHCRISHNANNGNKKKRFWFPSNNADWHYLKTPQRCRQFVFAMPTSWIGLFQISGEQWSVLGRARIRPPVWLNKIRPRHCIPLFHYPDHIKYSWATADS